MPEIKEQRKAKLDLKITKQSYSQAETDCSSPDKFDDDVCQSPAKVSEFDSPTQFFKTPADMRKSIDDGTIKIDHTGGQTPGFAQCNLAILPKKHAFDFLMFCQRNPKSCPLIDVLDPGQYMYGDIDIRRHVHSYRIYDGKENEWSDNKGQEISDLSEVWTDDLVTFMLGCSFSFEEALLNANIPVRHMELGQTCPMYKTNIKCKEAGIFNGNMFVSMRPMTPLQAFQAAQITARYSKVHGCPIHIGDPSAIGIADIDNPEVGEKVPIYPGEVPVFWACGWTKMEVIAQSKPDLFIGQQNSFMLVLDTKNEELSLN